MIKVRNAISSYLEQPVLKVNEVWKPNNVDRDFVFFIVGSLRELEGSWAFEEVLGLESAIQVGRCVRFFRDDDRQRRLLAKIDSGLAICLLDEVGSCRGVQLNL